MATKQIRINKTKDVVKLLDGLRSHFMLLSDAELMKVALSIAYKLAKEEKIDKQSS